MAATKSLPRAWRGDLLSGPHPLFEARSKLASGGPAGASGLAGSTTETEPAAKSIRVLAFLEAAWLTGPAKNLIGFARQVGPARGATPRAEVAIVLFRRGAGEKADPVVDACHAAGVPVHVIRERFAFDLSLLRSIRELVAAVNPDIVQTHAVKSHFLIRMTAARRNRKWLAFHHGYTWPDLKVRLYNQLDRFSLPAADHVVTLCQPFAAELQGRGVPRGRITVQHNSVAPFVPCSDAQAMELRRSLAIPPAAPVLLTVGRLSREKGHRDLVTAAARLRRGHPARAFRLLVVGDGPERTALQQAVKAAGIADTVIFAGHQAQMVPYYSIADLVVLPSHSEGSPNCLLEAMAAGLAVVATKVGGVPEVAADGHSSLLVDRNQPAMLAEAIARLLDDEPLRRRLGDAARVRAADFTLGAYCDSLLQVYRRVLGWTPIGENLTADSTEVRS